MIEQLNQAVAPTMVGCYDDCSAVCTSDAASWLARTTEVLLATANRSHVRRNAEARAAQFAHVCRGLRCHFLSRGMRHTIPRTLEALRYRGQSAEVRQCCRGALSRGPHALQPTLLPPRHARHAYKPVATTHRQVGVFKGGFSKALIQQWPSGGRHLMVDPYAHFAEGCGGSPTARAATYNHHCRLGQRRFDELCARASHKPHTNRQNPHQAPAWAFIWAFIRAFIWADTHRERTHADHQPAFGPSRRHRQPCVPLLFPLTHAPLAFWHALPCLTAGFPT